MAAMFFMWPRWDEQTSILPIHMGTTYNLVSIRPAVLEEKKTSSAMEGQVVFSGYFGFHPPLNNDLFKISERILKGPINQNQK